MEAMTKEKLPSLVSLPLRRLSARHCGLKTISRDFLMAFNATLEKLDLSCNPLHHQFSEITSGVSGCPITTLVLDFINQLPSNCSWTSIPTSEMIPLRQTRLTHLSVRANQIGITEGTDLRGTVPYLRFLDVGQNSFGGIGLYIAGSIHGYVPIADSSFFYSDYLLLPSIRYLGLDSITKQIMCGYYDTTQLQCNEDSELMESDSFDWDTNSFPDFMEVRTLYDFVHHLRQVTTGEVSPGEDLGMFFEILLRHPETDIDIVSVYLSGQGTEATVDYLCQPVHRVILAEFIFAWVQTQQPPRFYVSSRSVNYTVNNICDNLNGTYSQLFDQNAISSNNALRWLPTNMTKLSLRNAVDNSGTEHLMTGNPICSNIRILDNNLGSLDLSGSYIGQVSCSNFPGLIYLKEVVCRHCQISGWVPSLFGVIPVTHLDFSHNKMNGVAESLMKGNDLLANGSKLLELRLGSQSGGIERFADADMFEHQPHLQLLDLRSNRLAEWSVWVAEKNPELVQLDLRDNEIQAIDVTFRRDLERLWNVSGGRLNVDLRGNPMNCACEGEARDYLDWLLWFPAITTKDEMICSQSMSRPIKSFVASECSGHVDPANQSMTWILASVMSSVVLVGLFILLLIKRRSIVAILSRRNRFKSLEEDEQVAWKHRLYASCVPTLADRLEGIMEKLREHDVRLQSANDVLPGAIPYMAISEMIGQADRCILFLTDDYFASSDAQQQYKLIETKGLSDALLVSVMNNPVNEMLPAEIQARVHRGDCLELSCGPCSALSDHEFVLALCDELDKTREITSATDIV